MLATPPQVFNDNIIHKLNLKKTAARCQHCCYILSDPNSVADSLANVEACKSECGGSISPYKLGLGTFYIVNTVY